MNEMNEASKVDFSNAFSEVFGTEFNDREGAISNWHYAKALAHSKNLAEHRNGFLHLNSQSWQDIEDEVIDQFKTWDDILLYVDSSFEEQLRIILGSRIYVWYENDSGYQHLAIDAKNSILDQEKFPTIHLQFCCNMNGCIIAESTIYPQDGVEYDCQFMAYQKWVRQAKADGLKPLEK